MPESMGSNVQTWDLIIIDQSTIPDVVAWVLWQEVVISIMRGGRAWR